MPTTNQRLEYNKIIKNYNEIKKIIEDIIKEKSKLDKCCNNFIKLSQLERHYITKLSNIEKQIKLN